MAGHLAALALLVGLLLGWVVVQRAWLRAFPGDGRETDALAGRTGCAGAACRAPCPRERCPSATAEEGST